MHAHRNTQTERQRDRQTDGRTDGQTDRQRQTWLKPSWPEQNRELFAGGLGAGGRDGGGLHQPRQGQVRGRPDG
eukprot:6229276-Alexandrium_andersonii.AAC.1